MANTPLQQLAEHGQSVGSTTCPVRSCRTATWPASSTRASWASPRTRPSSRPRSPTATPTTTRSASSLEAEKRARRRSSSRSPRDDIRAACDLLRPTGTGRAADGWVSLEVDPNLAHDTEATIAEASACTRSSTAEPVHQDPGHPGGPAGDRGDDRGRHPGQRDADLLARAPPRGRRGLHPRPRSAWPTAAATSRRSRRWRRSSSRASTPRPTSGSTRSAATTSSRARSRSPTPSSRTETYQEVFSGDGGRRWRPGRDAAALPVGVDVDQEPRVPRRHLRRGADRPRDREHDAARHRSRRYRTTAWSRTRSPSDVEARAAAQGPRGGRGRLRRRRRHARERGRGEVRGLLPRAVLGHRVQARPAGGRMMAGKGRDFRRELGQQLRVDSIRS